MSGSGSVGTVIANTGPIHSRTMATAASDDGKMRNPLFAGSLDDSANVDAPPRYSSDIA
jgi:hypothetical protein